jgi:hypothetical protein
MTSASHVFVRTSSSGGRPCDAAKQTIGKNNNEQEHPKPALDAGNTNASDINDRGQIVGVYLEPNEGQ